jgi:hypothetical protein
MAYVGMGKSLLRQGRYSEAMKYFKLGSEKGLYSKAFKLQRNLLVERYFSLVLSSALIVAAILLALDLTNKKLKKLKGIGTR